MQLKIDYLQPTKIKLSIDADKNELLAAKQTAVTKLSAGLKVAGFRPGKAPASVAEKHLDSNTLSQETLETAVSELYGRALIDNHIMPVDNPEVTLKTFVNDQQLSFEATVDVIGKITLGKYKGLKVTKESAKVSAADVSAVLKRLQRQSATKSAVKRAAKNGDEVVIDFEGVDFKTKEPISGASGKDYPLELGSNSFIPGFEGQLVGLKAGESKDFSITFPADYPLALLRSKKAAFSVSVKAVNAVKLDAIDDKFAASVGPFKNLSELKTDIKKQLEANKEDELMAKYQNELVLKIVDSSKVEIPEALISDEVGRFERDQRQNAAARGQTWQEYLSGEGLDEVGFSKLAHEQAVSRVKAGLILGEIASSEKLAVTQSELDSRLSALKERYASDAAMQQELSSPKNVQELKNRLLVEKTIKHLENLNPGS